MRRSFRNRRQARRAHDVEEPTASLPQEEQVGDWDHENPPADDTAPAHDDSGLDREFEPFVPVEAGSYRQYGDDDTDADEVVTFERPRRSWLPRLMLPRPRVPRPGLPRFGAPSFMGDVHGGILLAVVLLIASGIFGTLLVQGTLRDSVEGWWPVAILVGALLWMLLALVQRRVAPFLGAWALIGVGLSALLDTQSIALVQDTVLGIVLVTVGLGIAFRGFLLRQQAAP